MGKRSINFHFSTQTQTFDKRRLVGILPERVTNVSDAEYPGHYSDEDLSWNLSCYDNIHLFVLSGGYLQFHKKACVPQ